MASATATARADRPGGREPEEGRRPLFRFGGSRLGGFILALNLLSLLILFGGALLLNEWSKGLVGARQESMTVQAELLANVLREEGVTRGEPTPELDPIRASLWLTDRFIPAGQRVRLYDMQRQAKDAARSDARKSQVGSGDRSERIRTYNFPQGRVTDHRIGLTLHSLPQILEGDIDPMLNALIAEDQAARLADLEAEFN